MNRIPSRRMRNHYRAQSMWQRIMSTKEGQLALAALIGILIGAKIL